MGSFNRKSPLSKKVKALEKLSKTIRAGMEDLSKKVEEKKKLRPMRNKYKKAQGMQIKYSNRRTGTE